MPIKLHFLGVLTNMSRYAADYGMQSTRYKVRLTYNVGKSCI